MTEHPEGLRERKNRRTQLAIVRAAADLVREEGYERATLPRIAERAEVAPRTVSRWFPSKDHILFGRDEDRSTSALEHLDGGRGDVVDRLAAWLEAERGRDAPDTELARLRHGAIQRDAELRARERAGYEQIAEAARRVAAEDLGAAPEALGPRIVAGATVALLEHLRERALAAPTPDRLAGGVSDGLRTLRAVLAALR